jgi:hypothetical protein
VAESIHQGKALKKLASKIIMNGVSEKTVEFVKQIPGHSGTMDNKKLKGIVVKGPSRQIVNVGIHVDEAQTGEHLEGSFS